MRKQSNSVRRLLKILYAIKQSKGNKTGKDTFEEMFPVLSNKTSPVRVYAEIIALASKTAKDLSSLERDTTALVNNVEEVLEAFAGYSIDSSLQNLQQKIKSDSIRGLEVCAVFMDASRPEKILSKSDLEKLRSAVQKLMDEVANSDIDARLKQFMLDKLGNIEQAISMYEFHGIAPIENSLQETVGGVVLKEHYDKQNESFKSDIWDKLKKFLAGALLTIKLINATDTFIENVSDATTWVIESSSDSSVPNPALPESDVDVEEADS